jgi:hypothetical protein
MRIWSRGYLPPAPTITVLRCKYAQFKAQMPGVMKQKDRSPEQLLIYIKNE